MLYKFLKGLFLNVRKIANQFREDLAVSVSFGVHFFFFLKIEIQVSVHV